SCQRDLSPEQVEALVTARMSRQERQCSEAPPHRWAILDEAVLRRQMGSRECMYKQLARLLEEADTPHSKVQVMPFAAGGHALMGGALTLLTLPNESTVAYEEGIKAGYLCEDAQAARKWRWQYEELRANALSLVESAKLIRKAMEEYRPCDTAPN
ncbi:DUF5753 domain-containing protein, partial [Streptomyces sp. NPDC056405]